jgi:two-component system, cell cycle sensor histidine kinase and response regulator CckA
VTSPAGTSTGALGPSAGWRERLALRVMASWARVRDRTDFAREVLRAVLDETGLGRGAIRLRRGVDAPVMVLEGFAAGVACGALAPSDPGRLSCWLDTCVAAGCPTSVVVALGTEVRVAGTMCLGDGEPGVLGSDDLAFLERLGVTVGALLERGALDEDVEQDDRFRRELFDASHDAQFVHDATGRIVDVNDRAIAMFGCDRARMLGLTVQDLSLGEPPFSQVEAANYVARTAREGPQVFPWRSRRANGELFWSEVALRAARIGDELRVFASVRDISERREADLLLQMLKHSIDVHRDSAYWMDAENRFVYVNDAACDTLGYTREELLALPLIAVNPTATPEAMARVWARLRRDHGFFAATTHRRRDGSEFPVEIMSAYVRFGEREYNCGFARDITERKRAEQALRDSEEWFRQLADSLPQCIFEADTAGRLTYANRAGFAMFGRTPEALTLGLSIADVIAPEDRERAALSLQQVLTGEAAWRGNEYRGLRADGTTFPMASYVERRMRGSVVSGTGGIVVDITEVKRAEAERQKLQAELFEARKLESIGTLAGGIAHDFNNLLCGLLGWLSVMELKFGGQLEFREELREMMALATRGSDLTKQLLGFARRGKFAARPIDLNEVVAGTSSLFGRTRKDITVHFERSTLAAVVHADHAQIEQLLLNLLLNAGQAMPGGGEVLLRTEHLTLSDTEVAAHKAAPGRYVSVVVRDTGVGMDAATRDRIFEPFFTTKAVGKGTGLGLASAYGIVKNHGGFITVDSAPGRGATFSVFLPATDEAISTEEPEPAAAPHERATILLVDDEEQILKVTSRALISLGYDVLTARSGRQAVEVMRHSHSQISLVILDLVMPEMSGSQTFDALREVVPAVRVLLSSGFGAEGQAAELLARGCAGFLAKPYTSATLAAKVRELL